MADIYDILLAEQTLIEQYKSKGYTDYEIALRQALKKIEERLIATKGIYTTQKLNQIKKLIEDEIIFMYGSLFESIKQESTAIATISYQSIMGAFTIALPKETVNDLINSKRLIQMGANRRYHFASLFNLEANSAIKALRGVLATGVASGLDPKQLAREVNKVGVCLSKGRIRSNVRSVVFDSLNQGTYKAYEELEKTGVIKYYEHVSVMDEHTTEDICIPRDGRKYYMSIKEIPNSDKPLLHGNCRSKLIGRTESNRFSRRATQQGSIKDEPYNKWFNRQDDKFKNRVLGKSKFNMYKQGDLKVTALTDTLGKNISLEQFRNYSFDYVKS